MFLGIGELMLQVESVGVELVPPRGDVTDEVNVYVVDEFKGAPQRGDTFPRSRWAC